MRVFKKSLTCLGPIFMDSSLNTCISKTNILVGDHQVAVVDIDWGPEGGKSLDFLSFPTACLKKIIKIRQL